MDHELARRRLQRGVFVGRGGELQRLQHALTEAAAGRPRVVLLHGEAGVGKTALAGRLMARAQEDEWWCCRAQAFEPSLDAYDPWGAIVEALTRGDDAETLRQRLGRLAPAVARLTRGAPGPTDDADDAVPDDGSLHLARCQGIATLLREAARHVPVLLVLEDLHAADSPALQVLEHVVTHAGATRLLVVGTYRDDGTATSDGARRVCSRLPSGFCERISIAGLRQSEVGAMLQEIAGQPAPARFVARLHAASGGNPLLLVMMLWDLLEAGVLVHDGTAWRSVLAPDDITIPDSAGSLLDRRLERFSEDTRVVLQLASLHPSDFDVERLSRPGVLSREHLADGLDAALDTGLIVGVGPGRFRFRHGVFRHVLHARIGIAQRAHYHRLLGEALEARPSLGDAGVLEAAYHFRCAAEAGDAEPAVRWTLRAAELEWGRRSYEAAAEHFRRALALGDGAACYDDAWRLEVLTRRVEALGRAGKLAELREATREAVPLARRFGAERLAGVALAAGSSVRGFGRLRYDVEAVTLLEEALAAEPGQPAQRALLQARLAEELMMGDGDANLRARALMDAALAVLPSCDQPHVAAAVLRSLHWAPWDIQEPGARLARADEIVALAARAGDDELALEGEIARALGFLELGNPVRARACLGRVTGAARRRPYYRWALACMEACLAYVEGQLDDVQALAEEAHQLGVEAEVESAGVVVAAQVGALLWQRGAFSQLDDGLRMLAVAEPQSYAAVETVVRCAQAAGWAEAGLHRDALACVREYARDDFRSVARNALWLPSMAFLGLACRGEEAAPLAARLYALVAPYTGCHVLLPLMVSYGSVDYFLGILAETAGETDVATRHFETALESNRRAGTAQWLARTQVALARRLAAAGGDASLARARELLDAADGTSTRLRLPTVSAAVGATRAALPATANGAGHGADGAPVFVFRLEDDDFFCIQSPAGRVRRRGVAFVSLHALVRRPGTAIPAIDLVHDGKALLAEHGELIDLGSSGERADARTIAEVERALRAIEDELVAAEETGNHERRAELEERREALRRFLLECRDHRGRPRREPSASDKAYGAMFQRKRRVILELRKQCPDIAAHLAETVKTGKTCVYEPDPRDTPRWILA